MGSLQGPQWILAGCERRIKLNILTLQDTWHYLYVNAIYLFCLYEQFYIFFKNSKLKGRKIFLWQTCTKNHNCPFKTWHFPAFWHTINWEQLVNYLSQDCWQSIPWPHLLCTSPLRLPRPRSARQNSFASARGSCYVVTCIWLASIHANQHILQK